MTNYERGYIIEVIAKATAELDGFSLDDLSDSGVEEYRQKARAQVQGMSKAPAPPNNIEKAVMAERKACAEMLIHHAFTNAEWSQYGEDLRRAMHAAILNRPPYKSEAGQ